MLVGLFIFSTLTFSTFALEGQVISLEDQEKIIQKVEKTVFKYWPNESIKIEDAKIKKANIDLLLMNGHAKIRTMEPEDLKIYFLDNKTIIGEAKNVELGAYFDYELYVYTLWTNTLKGCIKANYKNDFKATVQVDQKSETEYELVVKEVQNAADGKNTEIDISWECSKTALGRVLDSAINAITYLVTSWFEDKIHDKVDEKIQEYIEKYGKNFEIKVE